MDYLVILDGNSAISGAYNDGNYKSLRQNGAAHPVLRCTEVQFDHPQYLYCVTKPLPGHDAPQIVRIPHSSVAGVYETGHETAEEAERVFGFTAVQSKTARRDRDDEAAMD